MATDNRDPRATIMFEYKYLFYVSLFLFRNFPNSILRTITSWQDGKTRGGWNTFNLEQIKKAEGLRDCIFDGKSPGLLYHHESLRDEFFFFYN